MSELSGTTKRVLDYLFRSVKDGVSPTVREIQDDARLSSTSVVEYHLRKLEKGGYIKRTFGKSRSIRLLDNAGDVVMVFQGEDAELVRERLGEDPARQLLNILATERAVERAGG